MACLFDSLSIYLTNNDNEKKVSSYELRTEICDYLFTNRKIIDDLDANLITQTLYNTNFDKYISKMREPCTWGSAIEIKAFCEMYKTKVVVLLNNKEIEFIPNDEFNYVIVINYTGNHYTPNRIMKVKT